jgi:hypothetical protein
VVISGNAGGGFHEIHLGDIKASLIRVSHARDEGCNLFEVFDEHQELHNFAECLFYLEYDEQTGNPVCQTGFPGDRVHPLHAPLPDVSAGS